MNWKNEATDVLRLYEAKKLALGSIPEELKTLKADLTAIRGAVMDAAAAPGGGSKREDRLMNNLVRQEELSRNLTQTKRWVARADKALSCLTEEERLVLRRLYICPESGAMARLAEELGLEQRTIYRRKDDALKRFTVALYGLCES